MVNGVPTGCVRISFGYMSTWKDVNTFIKFLTECFLLKSISDNEPVKNNQQTEVIQQYENNGVDNTVTECSSIQDVPLVDISGSCTAISDTSSYLLTTTDGDIIRRGSNMTVVTSSSEGK